MHYRERYILIWAFSWLAYALSYLFAFWFAEKMNLNILIIFNQICILLSGLFLLWGTYEFINKKMSKWWVYAIIPGIAWTSFAILFNFSIRMITLPTYTLMGLIYLWTGRVILSSYNFEGLGKHITGSFFILWGLYKLFLPVLGEESWITPWGYLIYWLAPWDFLINMVMTFIAAIGILLIFFNRMSLDLSKSEERFRLLAENARDMIYRFCLKPVFTIEYISLASTSIVGYTPGEFYENPRSIFQCVYPEDRILFRELLKNPEVRTENLRWRHKDGSLVWIEHNNVPIYDEKGNFIAIEGIARDITERKKAELAILEAKERVSRAERMASLGTMAAGIAHEINQPLNSLKVTADSVLYLHRKEKTMEINKIIENIKTISNQAARIDNIIKHMRSFIQCEISEKYTPCELNGAVESGLALISAQLTSHGIMIKKDLADNLPLIKAQSIHLEEIVINLVVNAMQALDKIKKDNKLIICKTYLDGKILVLEISDNGPGIDEGIKEKIFDPFFSNSNSTESMGLGLSIVQSIVKSYNGEVDFKNNENGGTTFMIRLPFNK